MKWRVKWNTNIKWFSPDERGIKKHLNRKLYSIKCSGVCTRRKKRNREKKKKTRSPAHTLSTYIHMWYAFGVRLVGSIVESHMHQWYTQTIRSNDILSIIGISKLPIIDESPIKWMKLKLQANERFHSFLKIHIFHWSMFARSSFLFQFNWIFPYA